MDIEAEKAYDYLSFVLKNLYNLYGDKLAFTYISTYEGEPALSISILTVEGSVEAVLIASRKPVLRISYTTPVVAIARKLAGVIENLTLTFYETEGMGLIYFAFTPRMKIIPPKYETLSFKLFGKLLFGNLATLFALSLIISYIIWSVFRSYAPYVIIFSQLPILLLAHKIIEKTMGDWVIDPINNSVYLVGIKVDFEKYNELIRKFFYPYRLQVKKKIYEETILKGISPTPEHIRDILYEYGVNVEKGDILVKQINVYDIVARVFKNYGLPVPKIIISNVVYPNAAATGVIHRFSGILITTGIIAKLTEEELEAIVAHEASHVKNRDPLLLYILSSIEYLSRVTVALALWRFFLFFPLLELLYVYISLTTLFFVAKFIEARADIEAALISGKPLKLANALRKIGLIRLIRETKNSSRLFYWLSWDTHPPLSFRIETLEEIGVNGPPKNIWRFAITRCLKDFSLSITS